MRADSDYVVVVVVDRRSTDVRDAILTGDYDPTATLDMDEAARDVEDAGRIVEMVTAHLGR